MDAGLLRLLMQSETIRRHFFAEVDGILIFDKAKFQDFVSNKAFLPDSYTAFKNRIGLTDARGYLKESRDVVLAWPYKDCVLEGGQTKEDKARQEVFWNTTLAPDDISRLFEPKVLTGFERWDAEAVAAGAPKPMGRIADDDNLLIKGNNLLALHSLKARYAGKVKVIYIDPPYNTEDDSFEYNDRFTHSAWLTFMKNRVSVALDLLCRDGLIFIHVNDIEMHYMKVMLDDVIGRGNFIATIPRKTRSGKSDVPYKLSQDFDWIVAYTKGASKSSKLFQRTVSRRYHVTSDFPNDPWRTSDLTTQRTVLERENSDFTMINPRTGDEFPVNPERCWAVSKDTYPDFLKNRKIVFPGDYGFLDISGPVMRTFQSEEKEKSGEDYDKSYVSTAFVNSIMDGLLKSATNKAGTDEIQALFGSKVFSYPKNEKILESIIEFTTQPGDLVLDFFAGSGTTAAVAHKMGRRWIAVEQMDYIDDLTARRLKKVIGGEQGGISVSANWKGGGSFVYAELAQWNAKLADDIRDAPDAAALAPLRNRLRTRGYVRPGVDLDGLADADFDALPLNDQKRVLIDCLDANHLYVNYGDMADEAYGISDEDMRVNRAFYGEKA
jgi:adenine-specific DNA-methyltransferase